MPLSFRRIFLHKADFTIEYLSKTYGKNFLHAQCYPTKYLIRLTDHLKSFPWLNKFSPFSFNSTLDCYIVIIINDELNKRANICQGLVALNMDLDSDKIEIENLCQSKTTIYKIYQLIDKTVEFITNLSLDKFKSTNAKIDKKRYSRDAIDTNLNENELINKQIQEINLLDKKDFKIKLNYEEAVKDNNIVRPKFCPNCYREETKLTSMTVLKSCAHWLCNHCWWQYLENSIQDIKVIRCPEWNCRSPVDVGKCFSSVLERKKLITKIVPLISSFIN